MQRNNNTMKRKKAGLLMNVMSAMGLHSDNADAQLKKESVRSRLQNNFEAKSAEFFNKVKRRRMRNKMARKSRMFNLKNR